MKKSVRVLLIVFSSLIVIISIALFSAPRIAESYIENNSQELLGRKVTVESIRLNYIRMALSVKDFVLYEGNEVDTFVSFTEFAVNVDMIPIIQGNYTVASLLLDSFYVNVDFDGEGFNFDDLMMEADSTMAEPVVEDVDTVSEDLRFTLNNVNIRGGNIIYYDSNQDILHEMSSIDFKLPNFSWDNDQAEADLVLHLEPQGELRLRADIDNKNQRYKLLTQIIDLDLAQFSGELKAYLASDGIEGILNNTITVNGSMENPEDIVVSGEIELSDFLLMDDKGEAVLENKLFGVYLDSIDMLNSYYGINKVLISSPRIQAHLYEEMTNFDQLMLPMTEAEGDSTTQEVSDEDSTVADPIFFKVDTFLLEDGGVNYVDHTLNRPFSFQISAMRTLVLGITPEATEVPVDYSLVLNKDGKLSGDVLLNMLNSNELAYTGTMKGLNLKSFSPYSEYYIARPISRGHFNFEGTTSMSDNAFNAENKIHFNDIELGAKTADDAKVKAPVALALAIVKDKDGDIKLDVPLSGDPSDPDFNVGKIVGKTLKDLVTKIAAAPFSAMGDIGGVNPERLKEIPVDLALMELSEDDMELLGEIAVVLDHKPDLIFRFFLEVPLQKEMESLALSKLKYDYVISQETRHKNDSLYIAKELERLDDDDDKLLAYVMEKSLMADTVAIEQQCVAIIGEEVLLKRLHDLGDNQNNNVKNYLLEVLDVDPTSISVSTADFANRQINLDESRYNVEVSVK